MSEMETVKEVQQEKEQLLEETPQEEQETKKKPKKSWKKELLEWVVTLAAAVVIALVVRTLLFEPVRVDGNSMANTLVNGEVMFVTKPEYLLGEPERFDVIICRYPNRGNTNFVKRIVGLPGDVVEMNEGYLYVNGEKYEEEYLDHRADYNMKPYTVPEGMYFVLGDNRSNSNDSHLIGPIKREMIVGHVRHVILPLGSWRPID